MLIAQKIRESAPRNINVNEISSIIYPMQTTYQEVTTKEYTPTSWRDNIIKNIKQWKKEMMHIEEHLNWVQNKEKGKIDTQAKRVLKGQRANRWDVNGYVRAAASLDEENPSLQKKRDDQEREETNNKRKSSIIQRKEVLREPPRRSRSRDGSEKRGNGELLDCICGEARSKCPSLCLLNIR